MTLPGFRLLDDGTLVGTGPLLPAGFEPVWLDRVADDGRMHRERIATAEAFVAKITGGWRPADADLRDAPLIDRWIPLITEGGSVLLGEIAHHPIVEPERRKATSMLLALDGSLLWARTISRFYRLGRPLGRRDDS